MIKRTLSLFTAILFMFQAQAQTLVAVENFEGGAADWVDVDHAATTHHASGGYDGGAYISMTNDINTTSGGNFGGYLQFRCEISPSELPSQNCSGGAFVGNWYLLDGIQELRFWFRHHSGKPGGLAPTIRVATPGNQLGGSAIFPEVPTNTWTEIVVQIDPQDPAWDPNWGSLAPNAVRVLKNVGRLQPGIWIDPGDPLYTESGVKFDIDDVSILGSTSIPAVVNLKSTLHPHHSGNPDVAGGLNDRVLMMVYGSSTSTGDPVNLDTDGIVPSTVRIGQLGGAYEPGSTNALFNLDDDSDGLDDARFASLTGNTGGTCGAAWQQPQAADMAFRAELLTGEVIAGIDSTFTTNCEAQCH